MLLAVTLTLFPLLYLTLEIPKRIVNDAIGAESEIVTVLGYEFGQITFLMILCGVFLISVIAHGLTKMRINTMKGIVAERMLRRFRYTLIARILRFPKPYVQRTSQGELVSMITAEAEPMGGIMGDAITQPVLQAGQMATILFFLFAQSVWLGLAAVALIPVQAWLIPKLQRQINVHNKERIKEVRKLAGEIGETSAGSASLRVNGGWRYRMAMIGHRLGTLFSIRLLIYRKKFFMKFLNNFITQLTPFFFYSVGGLLAIQGNITVGALVAALAAYKDLSSPWKELLTYYNQMQELSQRWTLIVDRFAPSGMIDEALLDAQPDPVPRLEGDIEIRDVTVVDSSNNPVLDKISVTVARGSAVAIAAPDEENRNAFADLLTREVLPATGKVLVGDQDLAGLPQSVVAARIGVADARPYVFDGDFGRNVMTALWVRPDNDAPVPEDLAEELGTRLTESVRSGNPTDRSDVKWIDPSLAQAEDDEQVLQWWLEIMDGIGTGKELYRRALDQTFDPVLHQKLARKIVDLRPVIAEEIQKTDLRPTFFKFKTDLFNPALSLTGNLFFAAPKVSDGATGAATGASAEAVARFASTLSESGIQDEVLKLSREVLEMLDQTFGVDGTDHPLFRQLGMDADVFRKRVELTLKCRDAGPEALTEADRLELLALPFEISAEQIGPAFTDELRMTLLEMRHKYRSSGSFELSDDYEELADDAYISGLTMFENAIFGKISASAGARAERLRDVVVDVLVAADIQHEIADLVLGLPTGIAGASLPSVFSEPLAISRAVIKKPDVLILNSVLAGLDAEAAENVRGKLRELLPDATIVVLHETIPSPENYDLFLELENGRLKSDDAVKTTEGDNAASADLNRKMRALEGAALFAGLPRKQLRLLAFGARWYEAEPDQYIFHMGDDGSDGAYLVLEGEAGIYFPHEDRPHELITTAKPGTLVGELALIRNVPRALDMKAHTDLQALRLGEEEFLAVVENDAATAYKILQVVAGYVGVGASSTDDTTEEDALPETGPDPEPA